MIHVTLNLSLAFDFLWIWDSSDDVAVKWAPLKAGHLYISKLNKCSAKMGLNM